VIEKATDKAQLIQLHNFESEDEDNMADNDQAAR